MEQLIDCLVMAGSNQRSICMPRVNLTAEKQL